MKLIENTFLVRLFRRDKKLFVVIGLYLLGILYYATRQREEFPFLLYGMYSLKERPQETYTTYSIVIEGQEIKYARLRDSKRELITSTLTHALDLINAGRMSHADEMAFKSWLRDYVADMRLAGDNKMDVYRLTCNYDKQGQVQVLKRELVYTYAEE